MTELELTTNVGLESFVVAEWLERGADLPGCDAGLTPGRAAGRVRIRAEASQEAVVARAKTLMAGGLLDHCVDILRAETAGRP